MSRKGFLFVMIMSFFCSTFAQKTASKPVTKTTAKTSPFVMHVVKFGETLTKISKMYDVTVTDILKANPSMTENNLMPEQIIRIPNKGNKKVLSTNTVAVELQPKTTTKPTSTPKNGQYHTVEAGQTMYSISKMYAIKVEDLQKWNNIKDFNLKVGSQIVVVDPNFKPNPKAYIEIPTVEKEEVTVSKPSTTVTKPIEVKKEEPTKPMVETQEMVETETQKPDIQASDNETQKDLAKIFKAKAASMSVQTAKGTGAPMTTTLGAMESVYFAMHKWLPIGTIIKIKNLVNSKIVYAKVIGKLPDTDENKHVIVRYSLGVKKDLQLQNGKCYVQVEYPN